MPHHSSVKKRFKQSLEDQHRNKAFRSAIRSALRKIREADNLQAVQKEVPRLFSMMDKAAKKNRAGFTANRAGNYKRKIHRRLAAISS